MTSALLRNALSAGHALALTLALCACGPANSPPAPTPSPAPVPTASGLPTTSPSPSPNAPLILGFKNDRPNLSQMVDSEVPTGFEANLARRILKDRLRYQVAWSPIVTGSWKEQLNQRTVRVAFSAISRTEQRNGEHLFAGPYLLTKLGLLVAKDSPLTKEDIDDLKGLTVCHVEGTTAASTVERLLAVAPPEKPPFLSLGESSTKDCLTQLADHPRQVFLSDAAILQGLTKSAPENEKYRFIDFDPESETQAYSFVLRPEDKELCLRIDDEIDAYLSEPDTWYGAYSHWLGSPDDDPAAVERAHKPKQTVRKWCDPSSSQQNPR